MKTLAELHDKIEFEKKRIEALKLAWRRLDLLYFGRRKHPGKTIHIPLPK